MPAHPVALVAVDPLQLFDQRRALEPEQRRRLTLVAAGALERLRDQTRARGRATYASRSMPCSGSTGGRIPPRSPMDWISPGSIADVDLRAAAAQRQRALDRVLELPDVARPVVRHQPAHRLLRERHARPRRIELAPHAIEEVLGEQRNVLAPLAQRRHVDGNHVQPIEQILAERLRPSPSSPDRSWSPR